MVGMVLSRTKAFTNIVVGGDGTPGASLSLLGAPLRVTMSIEHEALRVKNTLSIFGRAMMASLASFPRWT